MREQQLNHLVICCCMVPKAAYRFVVSRNSFLNDGGSLSGLGK